MRHYEIVVLVRSGQQERVNNMAERYKKIVTDKDGAVHRFEDWGNRPLAYAIGKQLRAHYFLMNIECSQEVLDELKETFRFSESIMRFLVIRREEAVIEPSPIIKEMANIAEHSERNEKETANAKISGKTETANADAETTNAKISGKTETATADAKTANAKISGKTETATADAETANAKISGEAETATADAETVADSDVGDKQDTRANDSTMENNDEETK